MSSVSVCTAESRKDKTTTASTVCPNLWLAVFKFSTVILAQGALGVELRSRSLPQEASQNPRPRPHICPRRPPRAASKEWKRRAPCCFPELGSPWGWWLTLHSVDVRREPTLRPSLVHVQFAEVWHSRGSRRGCPQGVRCPQRTECCLSCSCPQICFLPPPWTELNWRNNEVRQQHCNKVCVPMWWEALTMMLCWEPLDSLQSGDSLLAFFSRDVSWTNVKNI